MIAENTFNQNFLRKVALVIALAGAAGSLYFMFKAGSKQDSVVLLALFTIWVISPFVGFFVADKISVRRTNRTRVSLYYLILILTIVSLLAYSRVFIVPGTKPAFVFLVVPFLSWLVMGILLIVGRIARKK